MDINQTISQLERIKKLLDDKAINEEEYNSLKKRILDNDSSIEEDIKEPLEQVEQPKEETYIPSEEDKLDTKVQEENEYEVDLGLPSGLFWSKYNVGAKSITDIGKYFSVGEEYNKEEDSVSSKRLVPTKREFKELIDNCYWSYKKNYHGTGVNVYVFISKANSNEIVFPLTGYMNNGETYHINDIGQYWTCSKDDKLIYTFSFSETGITEHRITEYFKLPIRTVRKKD